MTDQTTPLYDVIATSIATSIATGARRLIAASRVKETADGE